MKAKEILRWAVILLFGFVGLSFFRMCLPMFRLDSEVLWFRLVFALFLTALMAGLPLAISYFAFRRQYGNVSTVVAFLGAFVLFGSLSSLMSKIPIDDFLKGLEPQWQALALFPLLFSLLFPFFAARWFYRFSLRLVRRFFPALAIK